MEEKDTQQTKMTFGGFLTRQNLPGKLRGGAKGLLILYAVLIFIYSFVTLNRAGFTEGTIIVLLYIGLSALCFLPMVWLLYAAADIHEKTMENNELLRNAFPKQEPPTE